MIVAKTRSMTESELRSKNFPFFLSPRDDAEILDRIYKIIPNKEALADALIALRRRSGVQVFFGDKKQFVDSLKQNKAKSEDDYAASVYSSVPTRLVLAVVPLGDYEQKKLMGTAHF